MLQNRPHPEIRAAEILKWARTTPVKEQNGNLEFVREEKESDECRQMEKRQEK